MVTATDFWSASVLGTSLTAAWPSGPAARAAATAVHNFLNFMNLSFVQAWLCASAACKREDAAKGVKARIKTSPGKEEHNEESIVGCHGARHGGAGRLRPHEGHDAGRGLDHAGGRNEGAGKLRPRGQFELAR